MHSPVDDSSTHRSPATIGLTIAAVTGAAVLGVIGARALARSDGNVGRRLRRIVDALTNRQPADDDAEYEAEHVVGRTVTIDRPRSELYAFWRKFSNLPRILENIESVTELDERRSHWVVRAPAGTTVEWDSVII